MYTIRSSHTDIRTSIVRVSVQHEHTYIGKLLLAIIVVHKFQWLIGHCMFSSTWYIYIYIYTLDYQQFQITQLYVAYKIADIKVWVINIYLIDCVLPLIFILCTAFRGGGGSNCKLLNIKLSKYRNCTRRMEDTRIPF